MSASVVDVDVDKIAEQVLRTALSGQGGLKIHVGKIGKNIINGYILITGDLVRFRRTDDMVGFAVLQNGGLQRSYQTGSVDEFIRWIESIDIKQITGDEVSPGAFVRFDCPNC